MEIKTSTSSQSASQAPATSSDLERWASLIGGGAMVLMGLQQRSLRGVLMAVAGGGLMYQGATQQSTVQKAQELFEQVNQNVQQNLSQSLRIEKTVTINKPVEDLYNFWHNFENLPTFMKHLKFVRVYDERRSHWIANAPLGNSVEWDAEIIQDEPNRLISWASVAGADVDNSGFVRFQPGPVGRGTEVKVVMEYSPPGGIVGATIARLFGEEPEQQIGDELYRFKQLMEAGEMATTEGQSTCRSNRS